MPAHGQDTPACAVSPVSRLHGSTTPSSGTRTFRLQRAYGSVEGRSPPPRAGLRRAPRRWWMRACSLSPDRRDLHRDEPYPDFKGLSPYTRRG